MTILIYYERKKLIIGKVYLLDVIFFVIQVNSAGTTKPTSRFLLLVTNTINLFASSVLKKSSIQAERSIAKHSIAKSSHVL